MPRRGASPSVFKHKNKNGRIKIRETDELQVKVKGKGGKKKLQTVIKAGDLVWHPKWGTATVLSIRYRRGAHNLGDTQALIKVHKHPNLKDKPTHIQRWVMVRKLRMARQ